MTTAAASPGRDAGLAAALFATDPAGLGGAVLRGPPGPGRDAWLARLRALLPADAPLGRAPAGVADERLLGGLDLAASLGAGRPLMSRGLLAAHDGGVVVLPGAERLEEALAARLAAVLDTGEVVLERDGLAARPPARLGIVLLDEGRGPEERPPARLLERAAFLDLDVEADRGAALPGHGAAEVRAARGRLAAVAAADDALVEAVCAAAAALGVVSIRPPLMALRAARAHAALHGRTRVEEEDAAAAVRLVLVPRAVSLPEEAPPAPPDEEPAPDRAETEDPEERSAEPAAAAERVLDAARALLPKGLLERVVRDNRRAARTPRRSGAGSAAKAGRRGRPAGSRAGPLRPGDRLDITATLRAAAPWRRLRAAADDARLPVRTQDFRIRRFVQRRESTTVFVVDASGSAAVQRLAEAKGAVELLLAKAYVSRARVALIAFRDAGAQVLLGSTRSLTLARRRLADLPGGGGTPLAAGLDAGLALALEEAARDRTPLLVVLTDGRANIARDGAPGREAAERDALAAAARIGEAGVAAAFLDTSARPRPDGDRFARAMHATYAPLPYADAGRVSAVVDSLRGRGG